VSWVGMQCGKVCLSLLGTWSGPGWDPKRSTLLQVLVSIQSLIMVRPRRQSAERLCVCQ
jgi:ubiquitin-protein ligase